ncbi:phage tail protein [Rhizobium paknamense]|uniref:Tip attachment protein J domain-containing protein n=1 Tax=Rhizobium paknamense TaxID=1206817 RepID=A0ABU0IED9_9HYPH|nr:phage tail protein [Rhizobium paknamense]MDQ0456052.1 hypothetical protein [Rhizobium paknamense]
MAIFSSIAAAVGSAIAAVSTFVGSLGAIGGALLKAAVGVGINLIASKIAGNKTSKASFSVKGQLQSGGTVPRSVLFGMTATAGSLVYANTWGTAGGTPNAYLSQVIALSDMPSRELLALTVNGVACEIDFDNPHADYGYPVKDYRKDGKNYLWIKFYDGSQTVADPFMVSKVSSSERPYEATRVGHGITYVIATSRVNQELFSGFPSFKFVVLGMRLYDPSKDSSVGGNGTQRWSDASTWGGDGDLLPMVQLYNLLRGIRWNGQWLYGLQTVGTRQLPAAHWIRQIGKCRTEIEGASGAEPTYRSGAEVSVDAQIRDAADAMLTACQGRLAEIGGTYKPYVGVPDDPVLAFTDADIISTQQQSFTPFFGLSNTVNGITASYPSPDDGWSMTEAPPLYSSDYEAEDGGRRLLADVQLDFVPYAEQVQRLIKSALEEARRARRHTFYMPPGFWMLEPGDVISWTSSRNGYATKRFRVDGVLDQPNLDVVLDLTEVDPTDYSWDSATQYQPPTSGSLVTVRPATQSATGWAVEAGSVTDADSNARKPAIVVSCTAGLDDVARVWVQVRIAATGVVVYDSDAQPYNDAAKWTLSGSWCLGSTDYEVRGKLVPVSSRATEWSDWIAVTTLAISDSVDVLDNSITAAKLADAAVTAAKIMDEAITSLKLADEAVTTAKLAVAAVTSEILAAKAVTAAKIDDAAITARALAAGAVDATKLAASIEPVTVVSALPTSRVTAYVSYGGQSYRWNGSAYVKTVATAELTGTISAAQIAANAITADKIAANAITTAAIAAGAVSADQIAANAITAAKIAAGAISADKLAVGTGANWFVNSDCQAGKAYWGVTWTSGGTWDFSVRTTDSWVPPGGAFQILQTDGSTAGYYADLVQIDANGALKYWDVVAGNWYEVSCYYYGHRGSAFSAYLIFTKADGTWVNAWQLWGLGAAQNSDPQNSLASYLRPWAKAQAPAGAVKAYVIFRSHGSATAGVTNSYLWLTRMYLGDATANQSQPSAWQPAGATLINGGSIVANAITTDLLAANAVTAAKLAAGSVVAEKIAAGAVTADKIAAASITGDKVAANTIGANQIAADSITAKHLVLTDFSNLVPDNQVQAFGSSWIGNKWTNWNDPNLYSSGMSVVQMRYPYQAGTAEYGDELSSEMFTVESSTGYRIYAAAYSNNPYGVWLRLHWFDTNKTLLGWSDFLNTSSGTGAGLQKATQNVTSPGTAKYARVHAYVQRSVTSGDVWVGGFSVQKRNAADLIVDGSITANQLSVNSLSAITANLGTVTAGVIQSSNGKMQISLNAGTILITD